MQAAIYSHSSETTAKDNAASFRKTAFWAGAIYLVTFVSVPTLSLYVPIRDPDFVISSGPDIPIIIGMILEIIVGLSGMATAVALYPVLKRQSESGALGLVAARILEATMIFAGVACLLTLVSLRQTNPGPEATSVGRTLGILYDRIFLVSQNLMPAVCDLTLGILFYQSRLIPRALSVIGIIGGVTLFGADAAMMFGVLEQWTPTAALGSIGVAVFEFTLGIWLVIKGFSNTHRLKS